MNNNKHEVINGLKKLLGNLIGYFSKTYTEGELQISSKEVGGKVEMIQADGSLAPAPDGEYPMEDGNTYVVAAGIITEIKPAEAPADAQPQDQPVKAESEEDLSAPAEDAPAEAPVDQPADQPSPDAKVAELESKVAELEAKVEEMASAMESMISEMMAKEVESVKSETLSAIQQFNKVVEEMNNNIKTLAKTPVQFSQTNSKPSVQDEKHEKMKNLLNILK